MANSVIQIRRSNTAAAPTTLAKGEQAYSNLSGVLFIGDPTDATVTAIGGKRFPGILTANQALVANATSFLNEIKANTATAYFLKANNDTLGTDGQILTSNSTGGIYWGAAPSGTTNLTDTSDATTVTVESSSGTDAVLTSANATNAGILTSSDWSKLNSLTANGIGATTNTQVFFNNSNTIGGDANFTYDTSTDILTVVGGVKSGNSTANVTANSTVLQVINSTSTANLTPLALTIGSAVVNSTVLTISTGNFSTGANVGANVLLTTTGVRVGNSTVNTTQIATLIQASNSTSTANLTPLALTIGSAVVNSTVLTIGTGNFSSGANVGANVLLSTTTVFVGNSTVNSTQTATEVKVVNSTGNVTITAGQLAIGASLTANSTAFDIGNTVITSTNLLLGGTITVPAGSNGTAGQVLTSNGATSNVYWSTPTTGTVTSITAGSGLTGGVITTSNTIAVLANSGLVSNSTGVFVLANNGIVANSTGVFVNANTTGGLVANSTALSAKVGVGVTFDGSGNLTIGQAVTTTSNVTFNDVTVSGNLVVSGTLTTLDVSTLSVEDPLIELSRTQANTSVFVDTLDIGFYGQYGNTANVVYTGLFRDRSDSGIFKLFTGQIPAPTTEVDTANVNFSISTLQTYLKSGGLVSNATSVYLTANSTVNVNVTANTVTVGGSFAVPFLANNGVLIGQNTSSIVAVSSSTEGHVLQINSSGVPTFGVLDGGGF